MSRLMIAIDGPAASGKSTVSRRVAARLGWMHVDSGALYRALTWKLLRDGWADRLPPDLPAWLAQQALECRAEAGSLRFRLGGEDPGAALRSAAVRARVSAVAAEPAVRAWVGEHLRRLTSVGPLVVEGRDIGTVVFPDARHKIYLDADPLERARRRQREQQAAGEPAALASVARELQARDARDAGRADAPLAVAPDAWRLDTTGLTLEAVIETVCARIAGNRVWGPAGAAEGGLP